MERRSEAKQLYWLVGSIFVLPTILGGMAHRDSLYNDGMFVLRKENEYFTIFIYQFPVKSTFDTNYSLGEMKTIEVATFLGKDEDLRVRQKDALALYRQGFLQKQYEAFKKEVLCHKRLSESYKVCIRRRDELEWRIFQLFLTSANRRYNEESYRKLNDTFSKMMDEHEIKKHSYGVTPDAKFVKEWRGMGNKVPNLLILSWCADQLLSFESAWS